MKVKVRFKSTEKVTAIKKVIEHPDAMVVREEDDKFIILLKNGSEVLYSKNNYILEY